MRKRYGIAGFLVVVLLGLFICPMQAAAYFGVDEDYLLRTEQPEGRGTGPYHYLEFVSGDMENYTVQTGDTLWGIAREYYGSGMAFEKLWEDNADRINTPETLQVGTRLDLEKRFYVNVGMQDYIHEDVMHTGTVSGSEAWYWNADGYPYQISHMLTKRNDLEEKDPYRHWEAFQREVTDCGRRLCRDRVSEITFERYQVTDVCDLCYYQFVFDGGSSKYLIMAAFVYAGEIENEVFTVQNALGTLPISHQHMKNEVFTVCDLDRCDEADLEEAKGKTFYMAARSIDSLMYQPKMEDYVGADDWNYPELHNPFTQAMRSLCEEPLARTGIDSGEYDSESEQIHWKDSVLEELVQEQLAGLWQLTDEEKKAFMARPMTTADLAGVERLGLYENREKKAVYLKLNDYEADMGFGVSEGENRSGRDQTALTTLDDLANFTQLRALNIYLRGSDIVDFSAVGELAGLRELVLMTDNAQIELENNDLLFLGKLKNLRKLNLFGRDQTGDKMVFALDRITDLSILENCPHLAYLRLTTGNVESYDFLGKLPEMYYIELMGRDDMKNVSPDIELLPNACYINCYGEELRYDIGGK